MEEACGVLFVAASNYHYDARHLIGANARGRDAARSALAVDGGQELVVCATRIIKKNTNIFINAMAKEMF